ncbi:MAG: triose-phosphate isomerase [Actinobacteria bacterium]|nr:triose-phosphate isomerase [Actinomycetota bacterium]NCU86489.1 triose-phosphate isomerase [Actinomycetota bacterium]NDE69803.1 triose-phosphate isomerase [Actinomycetota bacterium]
MSNEARKPIISGNWKMNHNHFEAIQCVQKLAYLLTKDDFAAVDVTIHPPFTDLRSVQTLIDADELKFILGAQHCHEVDSGAFTGEISAMFLAKLNVSYVIVGHSERREIFGETDESIHNKIVAIQKSKMTPILCVGETLAEREAGTTYEKVLGQLRSGLEKRTAEQIKSMVIAYEPIWAIGTGKTATADDAQRVVSAIREEISKISSANVASAVRLQYGGSVKASNIAEIMAQPDIDGVLVGGASLDAAEFARICQYRLKKQD